MSAISSCAANAILDLNDDEPVVICPHAAAVEAHRDEVRNVNPQWLEPMELII